jgi:hypothetical protein
MFCKKNEFEHLLEKLKKHSDAGPILSISVILASMNHSEFPVMSYI